MSSNPIELRNQGSQLKQVAHQKNLYQQDTNFLGDRFLEIQANNQLGVDCISN